MRWPSITFEDIDSDFIVIESKPFSFWENISDPAVREIANALEEQKENDENGEVLTVLRSTIIRLIEERLLDPTLEPKKYEQLEGVKQEIENIIRYVETFESCGELLNTHSLTKVGLSKVTTVADFIDILLRNPAMYADLSMEALTTSSAKDYRDIQFIRDIERDMFCIDGRTLSGSVGFSSIHENLTLQLSRLVHKHCWWRNIPENQIQDFAKKILRSANRTESGGQSFDKINSILKCNPTAASEILLVPASISAKPLCIETSISPFREKSIGLSDRNMEFHALGIFCRVEGVTVYNLYHYIDMEMPLARVTATYKNIMCMHLLPQNYSDDSCANYRIYDDVGKAVVELCFESTYP